MRANTLLLMLILAIVPLSGCLGFGGDDDKEDTHADDCDGLTGAEHDACHDEAGNMTATSTGTGSQSNTTTSETPNVRPTAVLTLTDDAGNVLGNTSYILPGQNITFSAEGSEDPDGTIDLIGLTVKDNNGTRNAQLLVDGAFVPAKFQFNHVGTIQVSISVLDNRGERTELATTAYVDSQATGSGSAVLFDPLSSGCSAGPDSGTPLIDEMFFAKETFQVSAGATWISVVSTGTSSVAICAPDGTELASGDASAETDQQAGGFASGVDYFLALHPSAPGSGAPEGTPMTYEVIVHYEEKPAA